MVRDVYKNLASKYNAQYVNLIDSHISTQLREDPTTYYSVDKLHLSGEGYRLWFTEIEKTLP